MSKFKLRTDLKIEKFGIVFFRIEALVGFSNVNVGELGGYIEKESNLSQTGNAWVFGNAAVYGNARVHGNARVYGNAQVSGNAWVHGNAQVYGNAWVYGNAAVSGNAQVYGNAWVYGDAWVSGDARVSGNAQVSGDARVSSNAWVYGDAWVSGDARVSGNAQVSGDARVSGNAWVYGDAWVEKYGQCVVINNQKNTITIMPNLLTIGCKSWSNLEEFEKTHVAIGKENDYTDDEISMTAELVRAVMKRIAVDPKKCELSNKIKDLEIQLTSLKEELLK